MTVSKRRKSVPVKTKKMIELDKKYLYIASGIAVGGITLYLLRHRIYRKFDYKTNLLLLTLEPKFRKKVKALIADARKEGIDLRLIYARRTCSEQDELYQKGRKGIPGEKIVTNAKCGESLHNYGVAADLAEYKNGKFLWNNQRWELIGRLAEKNGLSWGGRWTTFVDKPHVQMPNQNVKVLFAEYKRTGKLAA